MPFFFIKPETSGHPLGSVEPDRPGKQPLAEAVRCRFDTWLGDDLVRPYPVFLVTTRLKRALEHLPEAAGFSFAPARVSGSPFFKRYSPGKRLPRFWRLRVHGRPGRDDMGIAPDESLVVSGRVLDVLISFSLKRAGMCQYVPRP